MLRSGTYSIRSPAETSWPENDMSTKDDLRPVAAPHGAHD